MTQSEINKMLSGLTNEDLIQIASSACSKSTKNAMKGERGAQEVSVYSDKKIRKVTKIALVGIVAAMVAAGSIGYGIHTIVDNISINHEYNDNLRELSEEVNILLESNYHLYGTRDLPDGGYIQNRDYDAPILAHAVIENADISNAYLYEIYMLADSGIKDETLKDVIGWMNILNPDGTYYDGIKDYGIKNDIIGKDGKIDFDKWKELASKEVEVRKKAYDVSGKGIN